jgi:hypothetical protein
MRERHAACVNADEGDLLEVGVPLHDLVCDPRQCPLDRLAVEEDLLPGDSRPDQSAGGVVGLRRAASYIELLSGLTGPS